MPPHPSTHHGRSNVPSGPKPAPLPMQTKPPSMANNSTNIVPTAIQQRPQPPKTILKHPSQYKPSVPQSQIQHQQPPPPSDVVTQSGYYSKERDSIQNSVSQTSTTITSHSITSQSHSNNLAGLQQPENQKIITTPESK